MQNCQNDNNNDANTSSYTYENDIIIADKNCYGQQPASDKSNGAFFINKLYSFSYQLNSMQLWSSLVSL